MRLRARGSQKSTLGNMRSPPRRGPLRSSRGYSRQLSRLKSGLPDQLGAVGALLLEILREVVRRVANRIDFDIGEAFFTKVRFVANGGDFVVQPRNDRAWGARRSDEGEINRR